MFPDVEDVLCTLLAQFVADVNHTGTTTPANLQSFLPFIRVTRFGGPDDGVTDISAVDIDYFAASRTAAHDGAEAVRQYLIAGAHRSGSAMIDRAVTDVGPRELPWSSSTVTPVRRFGGTYTVSCRRIPA